MVGDDGTRTELCADLVRPNRIKVYEAESFDVAIVLDVLEVTEAGHITLIGVVLPIKLDGDWAFESHVCQLDRQVARAGRGRCNVGNNAHLEKVELTSAHAGHAFADGRLDGGARNVAVFEYAPFSTTEDGAWWELLLELPLLA